MNPTLAGLATIPLMLQILILTYYGTPVKLLAHKQEELQRQVWATFIEHMVERKGDATRYPLDHTITLLGWLARQMRGGNFSFFEDADTADALLPRTYYTCSAWSVGLISPLVLGLGCALGALVILPSRLGFGRLIFGLIIGLIIGLSQLGGELDFLRDQSLSPQQWKDFRKDVWVPLFYPVIGLVGGLVVWLVLSLVNRLLFGLFGDSIAWLVGGPIGGPVAWLVGGVIIGLLVVLNVLSFIFVPHLAFRFWLWCSPLSPRKVIPFFEDATARMLLRRVGRGYSFIHRLLQEYFTALDATASSGLCPACSSPNRPDALFCKGCGYHLQNK